MSSPALTAMYESMSEAAFQRQVIEWADRGGWMVHHTHDSRHQEWGTAAGFPDLVLARRGRVIFAELKREGQQPKPRQQLWLDVSNGAVEAHVWRPSDGPRIRDMLCGSVAI